MKSKDYKRAWNKLKDTAMQEYIRIRKAYGTKHSATVVYSIELRRMDQLDGTNEFSNSLNDMEDK
jgi:hypothetical protein